MKKVISIILGIMIFAIPLLSFADSGSPVILPQGTYEDGTLGYTVNFTNGNSRIYRSSVSPVYLCYYYVDGSLNQLFFGDTQATIYYNYPDGSPLQPLTLSSQYNGFYYRSSISSVPENSSLIIGEFESVNDAIDYVNDTVFSTSFDLTYLIDGSVSWLSSIAQAVKANGLLLFFCLVGFVGISIGLLQRFRRG